MSIITELAKVFFSFLVAASLSISAFFASTPPVTHEIPQESPSSSAEESQIDRSADKEPEPTSEPQGEGVAVNTDPTPTVSTPPPLPPEPEIEKIPTTPTAPPPVVISASTNDRARGALVNVLCEMRKGRSIQTVTGSGVIVDPRGVILTNAHLAQYLLLTDYPQNGATTCTVRNGNPARDRYKAELLYLPITWIYEHAGDITIDRPSGTGDGDYAFLYITEPVEGESLPSTFTYLPMNSEEEVVEDNDGVLITSYPAIVTESNAIKNELYLVSTAAYVSKLFTFGENFLDLFALSGNIAAQGGSSGGAVVNTDGEVIGLIVTSTDTPLVLERKLQALTPAYINRHLLSENGTTIEQLLFGDLNLRSKAFALTASSLLTPLLVSELDKVR